MSITTISLSPEELEALQVGLDELREYGDQPNAWMSWEDFEVELDRAEAAGELPR